MLNFLYLKIAFYLVLILGTCLLPVYLFRKRWTEVWIIAAVIIYFFILNKDFILGKYFPWHDTMSHKYLLTILKQWIDAGIPIGWNPYLNGGEPLYLFNTGFLWAPWFIFCLIDKFINVGPDILFNLFWIFILLNFCIGCLLVFLILFDDFRVSLFCFVALVLGGLFKSMLGQVGQITVAYYFPYIVFGFFSSYKYKSIYGIFFLILFFCLGINHYLPHYVFLGAGVLIFFIIALNAKSIIGAFNCWKTKCNYKIILLVLIMAFLAGLPALILYNERGYYVSPSRGSSKGATVAADKIGLQSQVKAPLRGYAILLKRSQSCTDRSIHHAFYLGIFPLLLLFASFFSWRNKYIWALLLSGITIAFFGTGFDFLGFRFLTKYVPTFNLVRHTYQFSYFAAICLICLSGFGLKNLLHEEKKTASFLVLLLSILFPLLIILIIPVEESVVLFAYLAAFLFISIIAVKKIFSGRAAKLIIGGLYILVLFTSLIDLNLSYTTDYPRCLPTKNYAKLNEKISYPMMRSFFSPEWLLPPDLSPLVFKKATLTYFDENFVFLRDKYLNDMLRFFALHGGPPQALGVGEPTFYFTKYHQVFSSSISKEVFFINLFADCFMPLDKTRKVFFSEKDIDFSAQTLNDKAPDNSSIEYTKTNDPNRIEIIVDTPSQGFLVRQENFHRYWKVYIDGRKTKIYRANYVFQAIRMPAGKHKVAFNFNSPYPLAFWLYVLVCSLTWLAFNFYLHKLSRIKYDAV